MKKWLALLLVMVLMLSLCACGSSKYEKYADLFDLLESGNYDAAKDKIDQMAGGQGDGDSGDGNTSGGNTSGGENLDSDNGNHSGSNQLAELKQALVGEWVGSKEQKLQFRADGTCAVNGQTMQYTVELGTGMERACVYLGESKENAAAVLSLRLYVGNMCISGETTDQNAEYRLMVSEKGTLLTTNTYYDLDSLQRVELSMDNWEQYFELKEMTGIHKNGFGEIERFMVEYKFQIKEQYRNKVNTTLSFGSVATMQASGIFSCTITDMEKGTYQINHAINPDDLAEEVDNFGAIAGGLYGITVASAVMFCSDGGSYDPATATGTLLSWPDQLAVNRITGTLYLYP